MAEFLTDLFQSIFTPGPTPTLVVATNASFAGLQILLLALLIATYSYHFLALSILSAALWWAVNWFVRELELHKAEQERAKGAKGTGARDTSQGADDSGTETEEAMQGVGQKLDDRHKTGESLTAEDAERSLRKRRSLGDTSGDISTDSEWDKVEDERETDRPS
ncbi:SMK killer toxin resistance protein [Loxospora ochrophaea]|nr:SMK killer toxin resistance protein [Loxospora ochrophaea]